MFLGQTQKNKTERKRSRQMADLKSELNGMCTWLQNVLHKLTEEGFVRKINLKFVSSNYLITGKVKGSEEKLRITLEVPTAGYSFHSDKLYMTHESFNKDLADEFDRAHSEIEDWIFVAKNKLHELTGTNKSD